MKAPVRQLLLKMRWTLATTGVCLGIFSVLWFAKSPRPFRPTPPTRIAAVHLVPRAPVSDASAVTVTPVSKRTWKKTKRHVRRRHRGRYVRRWRPRVPESIYAGLEWSEEESRAEVAAPLERLVVAGLQEKEQITASPVIATPEGGKQSQTTHGESLPTLTGPMPAVVGVVSAYAPSDFSEYRGKLVSLRKASREMRQEAPGPAPVQTFAPTPLPKTESLAAAQLEPKLAGVGPPAPSPTPVLPAPPVPTPKGTPQPHTPSAAVAAAKELAQSSTQVSTATEDTRYGEILGTLELDHEAQRWWDSQNGHVELYLHPVGSHYSYDTLPVELQSEDYDFAIPREKLKGSYELIASFFIPNRTTPIPIRYPQKIDAHTKAVDPFRVSAAELFQGARQAGADGKVEMLLTLFGTGPGNQWTPKPLAGAYVRVLGIPAPNLFVSDAAGNVRISHLPPYSEVFVEVREKSGAYQPTRQVRPLFGRNSYGPIFLLQNSAGTVAGRVYDAKSLKPSVLEFLSLTNDPTQLFSGIPKYFDIRPTDGKGAFEFKGTPSGSVFVVRQDKPVHSARVWSGYGNFLEYGRGGADRLKLKVWDPYHNSAPEAQVSLVGDARSVQQVGEQGGVVFTGLDFPAGPVHLEAEGRGYAKTHYTLPYNPKEHPKPPTLFLLPQDVLEKARKAAGYRPHGLIKGGELIGGVENATFRRSRSPLLVELFYVGERLQKVASEHGPVPFGKKNPKQAWWLTPKRSGYHFFNLQEGAYLLRLWDKDRKLFQMKFVEVSAGVPTVVVH